MNKILEYFENNFISIWDVLPIVFLIFLLILIFVVKLVVKKDFSPLGELIGNRKSYKTEAIFVGVDIFSKIYILIVTILALIPILAIINAKFEIYIYGMLDKITDINSIIIGLTTIVTAMSLVIVTFDKNYYLVFSIREVLQSYKYYEIQSLTIVSCLVSCVTTMTLLDRKITTYFDVVRFMLLEEAVIFNLIGVVSSFYIIIKIMFSEEKRDLKLLDQLHRIFWLHKVDTSQVKKSEYWQKVNVEINIEYLIDKYIHNCKKVKTQNIKQLEFVTCVGCYKEEWYKMVRKKFIRFTVLICVFSILVDAAIDREASLYLAISNIIVTFILIGISFTNWTSVQFVLFRLFSDTWGYYINTNKKGIYIPRKSLQIANKYDKYVSSLNNIEAFFYIQHIAKINKVIQETGLKTMKRWLDSMENRNQVFYLPFFTIGYFFFKKKKSLELIKETYCELNLNKEQEYFFERMLYSELFYLLKSGKKGQRKISTYIKWLNG